MCHSRRLQSFNYYENVWRKSLSRLSSLCLVVAFAEVGRVDLRLRRRGPAVRGRVEAGHHDLKKNEKRLSTRGGTYYYEPR